MLYSNSGSDRYHGHHHYHPYGKSDRGYLLDEFKKAKPPTFDGELTKSEDEEAWLIGIQKLFELHDYIENVKDMIDIFNLKWTTDIWWEDVQWVKDIKIEELSWH